MFFTINNHCFADKIRMNQYLLCGLLATMVLTALASPVGDWRKVSEGISGNSNDHKVWKNQNGNANGNQNAKGDNI